MSPAHRVAVSQWNPVLGRLGPNVDKLEARVGEAEESGASLLVTPELGLTGYLLQDLVPEMAMDRDDPRLDPVADLSRRVSLAAGFVERGPDGQCYNAVGYWREGRLVHVHRKIYLPTYGMFDEARFFAPGRSLDVVGTPAGPAALLACEDLWHPAAVALAVQKGAAGLLVASAAPGRGIASGASELTSRGTWSDLLALYARLLGLWTLWSNRNGFEDGIHFSGGSLIVQPDRGEALAEGDHFADGTWTAELDPEAVGRVREGSGTVREEDLGMLGSAIGEILRERVPEERGLS
ncbi:MAG: nitrilase-related carbon-nitrogen hydrolase [bacterium]